MSHYFETPTGAVRHCQFTAEIWGRRFSFDSSDGVFSGSRLDPGTAVLLRSLDPPLATPAHPVPKVLDLGCGYGPIAVALAAACPAAEVTAVDVNERALQLTRRNAALAGVSLRVLQPNDVPPADRFDGIWSNPPIRIGKDALHAMLAMWLGRLAPNGVANLVVGKNLGADSLQTWLDGQGWPTTRLASAKGYRVLRVEAPLSPVDTPRP